MIPVRIETLVVGGPNESKIILRPVLDTGPNPQVLSINIGMGEALVLSIAAQTKNEGKPEEPDFSLELIRAIDAHLSRVIIYGISEEGDFLARVIIQKDFEEIRVEAKVSDAIAMALKAKVAVYVDPDVFAKKGSPLKATNLYQQEQDALQFHNFVEDLAPGDFMSNSDLDDLLSADNIDDLLGGEK